ncbi:MAG: YidC/Oxa1 family membrane protein insertase, partial [Candidatus Roizmanbacteria bacterium]
YLLIPLLTAFLQFVQFQVTTPKPAPKKEGDKSEPDMSTVMASQMKIMFPLMIGYFSYILPVGLAVYWNVFSIFSLFQHQTIQKGTKVAINK